MNDESLLMVNEIFYSIQGEGFWIGTPMVFIRFTGCNLACPWCDTEYSKTGGTKMTVKEILRAVLALTPTGRVCFTGGEPTLQKLHTLIMNLREYGFKVHIETNGTIKAPWLRAVDWITVSPKLPARQPRKVDPDVDVLAICQEIKVVIDGEDALDWAKTFQPYGEKSPYMNPSKGLFVQPEGMKPEMIEMCVQFVKANPLWRISPQLHKILKVR